MSSSMRPFIKTYTGKTICPLDLKPADIDIRDIAKSLSNTCRFGGHIENFYSTAEHSVLCWQASKGLTNDPNLQMACLLHDGCEGLTAIDHIKPCKANYAVALPPNGEIVTIGELERRVTAVMAEGLGLTLDFDDPLIKFIDKMVLNMETLAFRNEIVYNNLPTLKLEICNWAPWRAYQEFLDAYNVARCTIK